MKKVLVFALLALSACNNESTSENKEATQAEDESPANALKWTRLLDRAHFPARDSAVTFKFDGDIWLSNGWAHGISFTDLWRSSNGLSWRLVSTDTPYDLYSAIVPFQGNLYAVDNSVWRSRDGQNWEKILDRTPFADQRNEGGLFAAGDKIVFVGPHSVWASSDGMDWTPLNQTPPYGPRYGYASFFFKDKFWVMGGHKHTPNDPPEDRNSEWTSLNDIWWSDDGRKWHMAEAEWSPRTWLSAVVHDGRAYLVGGLDNVNARNLNETWVSNDGLNWSKLEVSQTFSPRHWPALWSIDGRLLVAGGNDWPVRSDVWELVGSTD